MSKTVVLNPKAMVMLLLVRPPKLIGCPVAPPIAVKSLLYVAPASFTRVNCNVANDVIGGFMAMVTVILVG